MASSIAEKVAEKVLKRGVKLDLNTNLEIRLWSGRIVTVRITGNVVARSPPEGEAEEGEA